MSLINKNLGKTRDSAAPTDARREDRRQAILDAAETLFLEQGFDRVSLAAIIRRSGGSLATAYELFGNKQGLLRAVISRDKHERLKDIDAQIENMDSAADILRFGGRRFYDYIMAPRTSAMMRIVIAESLNDREFARNFYQDVHLERIGELAELFRGWNAEGKAEIDDPEAAAELFLAMIAGDAQINPLVGLDSECCKRSFDDRIGWRLAMFIDHFRIR